MSTHAAIIARTPEGVYQGIYVHSDGYPEHTGKILAKHYATDERVAALIDLGDLSFLDKRIAPAEGEAHTFRRSADGVTIAYHRDRGEEKRIVASKDLRAVADQIDHSYAYVWEDGEWHAMTHHELQIELREREAWEVERAERAAGWDPNP
jgi:hypothetical protein